jgi:hypothetical protein
VVSPVMPSLSAPLPDSSILHHILGNSPPLRYCQQQALKNLSFTLAYEPELNSCEQRCVLNRTADPVIEVTSATPPAQRRRFDAIYARAINTFARPSGGVLPDSSASSG